MDMDRKKLENLKPYHKTTICPKCYEGDIRTEYHDGETFNCWYFHGHPRIEHFDRVCPNCRYRWAERIAITVVAEPKPYDDRPVVNGRRIGTKLARWP